MRFVLAAPFAITAELAAMPGLVAFSAWLERGAPFDRNDHVWAMGTSAAVSSALLILAALILLYRPRDL